MTISKWPSNDFGWVPLRKHFIVFNETHIPNDEDVGVIGVKKKNPFHKKERCVDFKGSISRIEKLLLMEFVHSVNVSICCVMSCC